MGARLYKFLRILKESLVGAGVTIVRATVRRAVKKFKGKIGGKLVMVRLDYKKARRLISFLMRR